MGTTEKCSHPDFEAQIDIAKIEDTVLKIAELSIRCTKCGAPAIFRKLPDAFRSAPATTYTASQEVTLAFVCDGDNFDEDDIEFTEIALS
ncbi:hypothetical protein [Labrys sp. ZIDIC5]|uniref:hypothetical protein n=1 Tax=Labrys sedimenti TaxID=3106036 RepID=UPI002ACAB6F2|nr:hypothetical protein [Labrys sp. ZIDIC5]MDZ5454605.1 hypothetical protein [Labrys sp. ZIDIC5]